MDGISCFTSEKNEGEKRTKQKRKEKKMISKMQKGKEEIY